MPTSCFLDTRQKINSCEESVFRVTSLPMKQSTKDHHEKSKITVKRSEKCICPKCGAKHKKSFIVPIHLPKETRRVFCRLCEQMAKRDYATDTYSLSGLGRSRDWRSRKPIAQGIFSHIYQRSASSRGGTIRASSRVCPAILSASAILAALIYSESTRMAVCCV